MNACEFLNILKKQDIDFFTGVPDSLLGALCEELLHIYGTGKQHIVAPNEGAAVALAAGYFMSCGKPACVYLQNSGLGNLFNPAASLMHHDVYGIPAFYVVGWRGEPGVPDEPQHRFQGKITLQTLETLEIPYLILSAEESAQSFGEKLASLYAVAGKRSSIAVVVQKGAITAVSHTHKKGNDVFPLSREAVIQTLVKSAGEADVFVASTGKISRELYEMRAAQGCRHHHDFLTVGSMGHCSSIALSIALQNSNRRVICLDGDGAILMHMGTLAMIGSQKPDNLIHVVLDNQAHESVGGVPTISGNISLSQIAAACGYPSSVCVSDGQGLRQQVDRIFHQENKLAFLQVKVALGSRSDLGRPKETPQENLSEFMNALK